ncbi:hypothetical protein ACVFYP_05580 [Roseomonas sp. F4]
MAGRPEDAFPRHKGSYPPHQHLRTITEATVEVSDVLDLVHVTPAGFALNALLNGGQIETRNCEVFGRPLAYFFIGRAAYRLRDGDKKARDAVRFPAAFVVEPDKLPQPYHVYPTDTGAMAHGHFPGVLMPSMTLEAHALENNLPAARRLITWAFGNYERYLDAALQPERELEQWQTAGLSYLAIARLAGSGQNTPVDARASSIEVAYSDHVPLRDHGRLVVLPDALLENPRSGVKNTELMDRLREFSLEPLTYKWRQGDTPDSHMADVARLVRKHRRGAPPAP